MTQAQPLKGYRVAILVMDHFEQVELTSPRAALHQAGANTRLASQRPGVVTGMHHDVKADPFDVELTFDALHEDDFDGVLLPGGVVSADAIRTIAAAQAFVKAMVHQDKAVAVICHGAWLLISSDLVRGKTLTSWPSLQDDLRNAGATWIDKEVVVDGRLISSRAPDDLPAFNRKMIEVLSATEASLAS